MSGAAPEYAVWACSAWQLETHVTEQSEAIVLRTYPLREADLLVTLFTRAEGKVKGIARRGQEVEAAIWRSAGALTWVRAYYVDREGQELARPLDRADNPGVAADGNVDIRALWRWSMSRRPWMSCCRTGSERRHFFGWRFPCCISCARVRSGCR